MVEEEQPEEPKRVNLASAIRRMNVAERIKLALHGNKEARGILIRDANRLVQISVVKNPRITENEVKRIASLRTVDDEVLRIISRNRDWMKRYPIKLALVKNPRTPLSISLKFLTHLREKDLKEISRSKNVPYPLVVAARRLYLEKQS